MITLPQQIQLATLPYGDQRRVRYRRLAADAYYAIDRRRYLIRADYIFDGASRPRISWIAGSPWCPPWIDAALLHDACYDGALLVRGERDWLPADIPPGRANTLFRRCLIVAGLPRWWAWLAWAVVCVYYHVRGYRVYGGHG